MSNLKQRILYVVLITLAVLSINILPLASSIAHASYLKFTKHTYVSKQHADTVIKPRVTILVAQETHQTTQKPNIPIPSTKTPIAQPQQTSLYNLYGSPCQSHDFWTSGNIYTLTIPPSCFGNIYFGGYGDCFGFVSHLDPNIRNETIHYIPRVGATVHIPPGDQGASYYGHWSRILAIKGSWALTIEENDNWRGGGWNMIQYRYLFLDARMQYYY